MNYFLASVGEAEILSKENGSLKLFASAHALTESVINFNGTMEEVRGGRGAKLLGRFSTNSSVEIQLTNVMFDLKEVAAQVGAKLIEGGNIKRIDQGATIIGNKIATTQEIQPLGNSCGLDEKLMVWICTKDCKNGTLAKSYEVELSGETETANICSETNYCGEKNYVGGSLKLVYVVKNDVIYIPEGAEVQVSYFTKTPGAMTAIINSVFNPPEFVLILKAKLFAADGSTSNGKTEVGTLTLKFPRFQFNGQIDLSMAMSSASTVSLSGVALVSPGAKCSGDGVYAEIVEIVPNRAKLQTIIFENQEEGIEWKELATGEKLPTVYGILNNGDIRVLQAKEFDFETDVEGLSIDNNGIITNTVSSGKATYIRIISKENDSIYTIIDII